MAMSVIGLLAITNLSNAIGASLPRISGAVWLLDFVNASIIFIVYASIEYTFANMLFRIEQRLDKVRSSNPNPNLDLDLDPNPKPLTRCASLL